MKGKKGLSIIFLLGTGVVFVGIFLAGQLGMWSKAKELNSQELRASLDNQATVAEEIVRKEDKSLKSQMTTASITEDIVADWIRKQGKESHYYFEGLYVEEVNLDQDPELEVLARIDAGVHLGDFFVFDREGNGEYQLIFERQWHVLSWETVYFHADPMKPMLAIVTRTGGTGADEQTAHLMYMSEVGVWMEAWTGTLKDRTVFEQNYHLIMGSYRFNDDNGELYYWQTERTDSIEDDKPIMEPITSMKIFEFHDGRYIEKP